jgi:transaldolase/glucose-6-phosphate isomerase
MSWKLPKDLQDGVDAALEDWRKGGKVRQLWAGDAKLWTGTDEDKWVGWLGVVDEQLHSIGHLQDFAADIERAGFTDALLLGMGGSSLGPEVLAQTFGSRPGFPRLQIVDSTDPAQLRRIEGTVDLKKTLFFVSSKSGSTLEPNIFKQYFFERAKSVLGEAEAAKHFVAVTDPGSAVEKMAKAEGFRAEFYGLKSIGGRYSVLSDFGMAPAAAIGLDTKGFLERTAEMARSCAASAPPVENPGVMLGAVLGVAATHGRDKATIIASPGIAGLGAWLEQLLAESTGKHGHGIVPVDSEKLGIPGVYSNDRVFAYVKLASDDDAEQEKAVSALEAAGQPVVRIVVSDKAQLGQEFFRWEMATAVAGAIIGIDPFDQPDVEDQKVKTRELTAAYEKTGSLPAETPFFSEGGISLYADATNAAALQGKSLADVLKAHFARVGAGDYVPLLAYIDRNPAHTAALQKMRIAIRDKTHAATCLGFGPRFLHSTGQVYKGGPNSGVVLQITCDDSDDIAVPGQKYTFGVVKAAQARGDLGVLAERGRRLLRVHLPKDVDAGLKTLEAALAQALR